MKMATRIRDRAIRRAGELLKQIEPAKPGPKPEMGMGAHTKLGREAAGEQAGMSKHQQVQAIRVANVPAGDFERQVESANPPTHRRPVLLVEGMPSAAVRFRTLEAPC